MRYKESDRIAAMTEGLRALGVAVEEREDGMTIHGGERFAAARVKSYADHRVAMSFAIAALSSDGASRLTMPLASIFRSRAFLIYWGKFVCIHKS